MTNNLGLVQVATNQNNKETTINDQSGELDAAVTDFEQILVDNTNARTLTADEYTRNMQFSVEDDSPVPTAAITLTIPITGRGIFVVRNQTSFPVTVTITAQAVTPPVIGAGDSAVLSADFSNVILVGSSAGGGGGAVPSTILPTTSSLTAAVIGTSLAYSREDHVHLVPTITVVKGGTGAVTAAAARINLGLQIGTDVQAFDADTTKNDVTNTFTENQIVRSTDPGAGVAPSFILDRFSASPAAADQMGRLLFRGNNSVAAVIEYASIQSEIVDPVSTSEDGKLRFVTFKAGANSETAFMALGLVVGTPTGGDKGAGTINASSVFDDNVLLTCYVFDQAIDGDIDEVKWNGKAPGKDRMHEPMSKFKDRIGGAEDPLDIDKYANHWKTKKHLTSLPNEATFDPEEGMAMGKWVQQLVETVEIQAVHIDNLNQRLKALEA